MNMPGTILSQFGMQIIASNRWASIIVSTLSAISSREGSEYFIPEWPIAIPSSTPMVLNRNGHAPGRPDALLDVVADRLEVDVPGMMSTWLLQMAMNGLFQSPSPTPVARRRLRWAARESPLLMVSERIAGGVGSEDIGAHLGLGIGIGSHDRDGPPC
jgi:hypothetical protein